MKRIVLASLLLATPALAQQQPAPGQRAWELMDQQCTLREQNATGAAIEQSDKVAALTKQLAEVTKERDALKAAAAKPVETTAPAAAAKPVETTAPAAAAKPVETTAPAAKSPT